jgi:hypothetical protein
MKFSRIEVCNALAVPIFYTKAKFGPLKKRQIEIKLFRRTDGYTLFDYKRNKEILEKLKTGPVDEKQRRYK